MQNKLTSLLTTSLIIVGLSGCVVGNQVGHSGNDVYSTFGNIDVKDGQRAGDLENNSGNITIGSNAIVKSVELTNGNIEIGELSEAYSLETVNGNIDAGKNSIITRSIKVMNGNINMEQGVSVGSNLIASNGDVTLAKESVVKGDITFEKTFFTSLTDETPILTITEGAIIGGKIHLYREVNVVLPTSMNSNKVIRHYLDKK
jgi:hypothetical protein